VAVEEGATVAAARAAAAGAAARAEARAGAARAAGALEVPREGRREAAAVRQVEETCERENERRIGLALR
jgi:hypothetical protein